MPPFYNNYNRLKQIYRDLPLSSRMSWSISIFSIILLIIIGIAAYRIALEESQEVIDRQMQEMAAVSYTHLRAHETTE